MEQVEFCGVLSKAASQMGMLGKMDKEDDGFIMRIADPATQVMITGSKYPTKEAAMESCLITLQNYLGSNNGNEQGRSDKGEQENPDGAL